MNRALFLFLVIRGEQKGSQQQFWGAEWFGTKVLGSGMQDSVSVFLCLERHKLVAKEVPKKSIYVVLYIQTQKDTKQGLCLPGTGTGGVTQDRFSQLHDWAYIKLIVRYYELQNSCREGRTKNLCSTLGIRRNLRTFYPNGCYHASDTDLRRFM
jgi:hypothetical protein